MAQELKEERVLVPIQVGAEESRWPVPSPGEWQGILQKAPWSPGEILRWIALEEGEAQAQEQWLQMLRTYSSQLKEERAARELTLDVAEGLFIEEEEPVARALLQDLPLARQVMASRAPAEFCLLLLKGCVSAGRDEARMLLESYRQSPLAEQRESWQSLTEKLAAWAFAEGKGGRELEELLALLPQERRQALGALARKQKKTPVERRYPVPHHAGRVGEELIRMVIQRQMDGLGARRPRRFGGLFLDLVLLRPPRRAEGETLPLLNEEGADLGRLPLDRLPEHQRRMVDCMQKQGEKLFALLDGETSLPSAGLWCAALYWKRKGDGENR